MSSLEKEYYTVKEVAKILGLTEQTIRNYIQDKSIISQKLYTAVVVSHDELQRQIELRQDNK